MVGTGRQGAQVMVHNTGGAGYGRGAPLHGEVHSTGGGDAGTTAAAPAGDDNGSCRDRGGSGKSPRRKPNWYEPFL